MDRPLLEKISWVAGIISAGIAAWLWLSPPKQSVDTTTAKAAPAVQAPTTSPLPESQAHAQASPLVSGGPAASCPNAAQIGVGVKTADGISSLAARDSAYSSLVLDALCNIDFDTAHSISRRISSLSARDNAYMVIVSDAVKRQDMENANRASGSISSLSARDRAKAMIINGIRRPAS